MTADADIIDDLRAAGLVGEGDVVLEHDVIAGAPAMVQKHEMAGRLVAPR